MASRDWVCTVCTAQNRPEDVSCRVCETYRHTSEKAETAKKKEKKPGAPVKRSLLHIKRDEPYVEREELRVKRDEPYIIRDESHIKPDKRPTPISIESSPRARTLVRSVNILWGVVLFFTVLQWFTALTLPQMIASPADIVEHVRRFSPEVFFTQLGRGLSGLWEQITSVYELETLAEVWRRAMNIASLKTNMVVAAQCLVLTVIWMFRSLVLGVLEADENITLNRPNRSYFTIILINPLLILLALFSRTTDFLPLMLNLLTYLFTLQTAGTLLILAAFLGIGTFTHLRMTRSFLKASAALVLLWFFSGTFCAI